jgi:hypothetical protein
MKEKILAPYMGGGVPTFAPAIAFTQPPWLSIYHFLGTANIWQMF